MKSLFRSYTPWACLVLLGLGVVGCGGGTSSSGAPQFRSGDVPAGDWGDSSTNVHITTSGGVLAAACLEADMTTAPMLGSNGYFDVVGNYSPAHGFARHSPAHFVGKVQGSTMVLNINVNDGVNPPFTVGPYLLTYGQIAVNLGTCP